MNADKIVSLRLGPERLRCRVEEDLLLLDTVLFFGFGIGVMNAPLRRFGRIRFVGWPLA